MFMYADKYNHRNVHHSSTEGSRGSAQMCILPVLVVLQGWALPPTFPKSLPWLTPLDRLTRQNAVRRAGTEVSPV